MKPLTLLGLVLCSAVLTAGIAASEDSGTLALDERLRRIDQFLRDRPAFLGGHSLQELRKLAPLRAERIEKEADPQAAGRELEYRRLNFDGLELVGRVESPGGFSPLQVTVTSAKWKLRQGLGVGTSVQRVESLLGPPMEQEEGLLRYRGTSEQATFHVRRGVIERVELQYRVD
ncbi:MAG TPA: hypothetical protein VJX92_06995 [Methylomirabilota bacterium]|nr:hypothetical protein [Methylomirabilota bacterium]